MRLDEGRVRAVAGLSATNLLHFWPYMRAASLRMRYAEGSSKRNDHQTYNTRVESKIHDEGVVKRRTWTVRHGLLRASRPR